MNEEVVAAKPMGELDRLFGSLFDPKPAFADVAARPRPWAPLLLLIVLALATTYTIGQQMGWERAVRQQLEAGGQWEQLSPEQREQAVTQGAKFGSILGYVGGILGPPILALIFAGIFLFVFNLLMGADVHFKQAYGIVAYSMLPLAFVYLATIAVLFLKDPRNVDLQNPVASNIGAFLSSETFPAWVVKIGEGIDAFSLWIVLLLATGFAAAARKMTWHRAFQGVLLTWVVYLVLKGGWAWIRS